MTDKKTDIKMKEFKTKGCVFTIPESINVRGQLQYSSLVGFGVDPADRLEMLWEGAKLFINKWECDLIPSFSKVDLGDETNPEIGRIVGFVAARVWEHMTQLKEVPKN